MEKELFADVILPLAVPNLYTYSIPVSYQKQIKVGQRVVVHFGKKKLYTALVYRLHTNKPEAYETKPIENILDADPITNEKQFQLWKWIADYYMCTIGEVMNAALPSGLKLASETKMILNSSVNDENVSNFDLSDDEHLVYDALHKSPVLTFSEAEEIVQYKSAHSVIKSLLEKNVVLIYEELKEKFKPKIEEFVRLTEFAANAENLKKIFNELEKRAFKQLEVLMEYVHAAHPLAPSQREGEPKGIKKSELLKRTNASAIVIHELAKKNVFEVYKKETKRFVSGAKSEISKTLSAEQQEALKTIKEEWASKEVVLLHGVTSSGKTEVYIKLIEETLKEGKQVLYLLPEIALTTHVVSRIKKYFGDALGVYHSRFNENERVEIWNQVNKFQISDSRFHIVLGARSALFLPFSNLGLVIVDEEHDASYKQFDPAPRYEARDSAIVLANIHKAKVLLGSATPSVESYYNAQAGKYGFAELKTRHGGVQMPEILIADVKDATKRKKMKSHFSPLLFEHIQTALEKKEQVILFQNRRGFAPYLECGACGWTPMCKNCDVRLVYHKTGTVLRCHYCGYTIPPSSSCKACGDTNLQMKNFGTEKIEEELQLFFPYARIARMDLDSMRSKHSYLRLLSDFEEQNIDVLVGTQMVAKGLDFDNVSTVGILSADSMMNFPHFRSHEKSFQMLAQVAGRAGRKDKRGKVIIQTYDPKNHIIQQVIENDFKSRYAEEIEHRKLFSYPPFYRLIELTVMHRDRDSVTVAADELAEKLKTMLGKRVLGPEFAIIPRIKNLYHKKILLKIGRDESASKVKEKIRELIVRLQNNDAYRAVRVQADVDPV